MRGKTLTNFSESDSRPILMFDSGIGGLPYLELARARLPEERFIYLADRAHYPYGEKEIPEIIHIVLSLTGAAVRSFAPKCVVVACNTASVAALQELRRAFDLPFIGVVPAVKPAAEGSSHRRFGVLATARTVRDPYLFNLIENFAPGYEVVNLPAGNLVTLVEKDLFSATREEKLKEIRKAFGGTDPGSLDSLVLGCTHFIHLEKEFRIFLPPEVELIDSREGVVNQLVRVLEKRGQLNRSKKEADLFFLTARKDEEIYRQFAVHYGLVYGGVFKEELV